VLATVALFVVAAVVWVAIRNRKAVSKVVRDASGAIGTAAVIATVLLAYPIWMGFFGPQHFTGAPNPTTNPYHTDLLRSIVPTPLQRVSLGMRSISNQLVTGTEYVGYIGLPVLILSGALAWWSRRSSRMQLTLFLMLLALLLSLGPHLAIDGHLTAVPLPFLLLDHLPLLNSVLPDRICLEVDACLAAVIAFGLDDMRRAGERSWRRRGSAVCAAATVAVLVLTQLPQWPQPSTAQSAVALPAALTRAIPAGDPVAITYPYDTNSNDWHTNDPMLWQAEDGFGFRLLGGYADHAYPMSYDLSVVPDRMSPPGTQQFLSNREGVSTFGPEMPVSPKLVAVTRSVVSRYDIRLVIVDRSMAGSGAVMELFNDALGPPRVSAGQFSMWANWHGRPSHEQFSHHLSTGVIGPANYAKVSGTAILGALSTGFYRVTKVEFILTDQGHHSKVIAPGQPALYGWFARWDTTSEPNGTYSLQSIAYDAFGASSLSTSNTITINN